MAEEYCSPHLRSFTNNIVVAYVVDNQPIQDGILERSLPAPTRALRGRRPQPLPPPFPLQVHPNRAFLANVLQRFINSELVMMTDTNWNEMVLASRIAKAEAKKKRRAEKLTKERRRGLLARPKRKAFKNQAHTKGGNKGKTREAEPARYRCWWGVKKRAFCSRWQYANKSWSTGK